MRTLNQLSNEWGNALCDEFYAEVKANSKQPHQQYVDLSNEFHSLILLLSLGTSADDALSL